MRAVPSAAWPTIAAAVEDAEDGTKIEVAAGYHEVLQGPLILDRAILIEGPGDRDPLLIGEDSIIVAAGAARNRVILRRLRFRISGGAPAIVIVGGCTIEECEIESEGVGLEVAAHSGNAARILRTLVRGCEVGISLAGGASAAVIEGSHVQRCDCGIALTGLNVKEGWSDALSTFADVTMFENKTADLRIQGWSVQEKATGVVREAPPGEQVSVTGWPLEQSSVVAPTDRGPVVLHVEGGRVNATLWDDEEADEEPRSHSDSDRGEATSFELDTPERRKHSPDDS